MIRTAKPIQLLEWGEGTNTLNQVWTVMGEGRITKPTMKNGLTTLRIELKAPLSKKNKDNNQVKLTQVGEGMTGASNRWGEVGMGTLKAVEEGGRVVVVEIGTATKIDKRK